MASHTHHADARSSVFALTVSALAESIIRERQQAGDSLDAHVSASVTRFLLRTQGSMPDYLRLPLKCLTLGFALSSIGPARRRFHRLPPERRLRHIDAWRRSRLGFRRDLIKFYETLAVFGWYAEMYSEDYSN